MFVWLDDFEKKMFVCSHWSKHHTQTCVIMNVIFLHTMYCIIQHTVFNVTHSVPFFPQFAPFLPRNNFCQNLHCFVARRFSSQVYALLSVKFSDPWDIRPERWRDTKKYILTNTFWQIQFDKYNLKNAFWETLDLSDKDKDKDNLRDLWHLRHS